jgi:hypothetical protein
MGSAAQRRGAHGGEYLWTGLRLHTRGERRSAKEVVKLYKKGYWRQAAAADQI